MRKIWDLRGQQADAKSAGDELGEYRRICMIAALEWVLGTTFDKDGNEVKSYRNEI